MNIKLSRVFILLISLAVLLFAFRACGWYGTSISGRGLEEGSQKPVADAFVIVRWQSRVAAGFAGGETACYHVELVKIDKNGNYKTPFWWSPGWHSPFDHSTAVNVYRAGYKESPLTYEEHSYLQGVYYLKPFKGTREKRLEYLKKLAIHGCGTDEESKKITSFNRALLEEAKEIAKTKADMKIVNSLRAVLDLVELGGEETQRRIGEGRYR